MEWLNKASDNDKEHRRQQWRAFDHGPNKQQPEKNIQLVLTRVNQRLAQLKPDACIDKECGEGGAWYYYDDDSDVWVGDDNDLRRFDNNVRPDGSFIWPP